MGLAKLWRNNKVLIVMGGSLGLIHWGWYHMKDANPRIPRRPQDEVPEPGIVAFLTTRPPPPGAKSEQRSRAYLQDEVSELAEEELAVGCGRGFRLRSPVHLDPAEGDEEQRPIRDGLEERQPIRGNAETRPASTTDHRLKRTENTEVQFKYKGMDLFQRFRHKD